MFSFRTCLWLCLPALIVAAALRVSYFIAIPEAFYGTDSDSYFYTAYRFWSDFELDMASKRRWSYPIFLGLLPPLPGNTVQAVSLLQHVMGLVTVVGVGWITGHLTRFRYVFVPLATLMVAVWPRLLYYENEVMAEAPFVMSFVLATAMAFPLRGLREQKRLFLLLGFAALAVSLKPHGMFLWAGLLVCAVLNFGNPLKWHRKNIALVMLVVVLIPTLGSSSGSNRLLLSSALPLVNTEGEEWQEYRDILATVVRLERQDLSNYAWNQKIYKKALSRKEPTAQFGEQWAALYRDKEKYAQVTSSLAWEAVLDHPVQFTYLTGRKILIALSNRETPNVGFDPAEFWEGMRERNQRRFDQGRGDQVRLVYELNYSEIQALQTERAGRTFFAGQWLDDYLHAINWGGQKQIEGTAYRTLYISLPGIIALFGLLVCFFPAYFRQYTLIWVPSLFYLVGVYAIGDKVTRYILPVEWAGFVLIAIGLDCTARIIAGLIYARRQTG